MILSCHGISKSFGEETILSDVSFHIEDREKAALIGSNGAGKTTLLRIMAGEMEADTGTVTLSGGARLGYLAQDQGLDASSTIYEEALEAKREIIDMEKQLAQYEQEMEAVKGNALNELIESYTNLLHRFEMMNGYAYKGEITGVLRGLGFEDDEFDKQISTLSGGQKTRVALARLLLQSPDVIMLDEPTNHLDLISREWMEDALTDYGEALLFVSHDRWFIEKFATRIWYLHDGGITDFKGGFNDWREFEKRQEALRQTARTAERKKAPKKKAEPNRDRRRARTEREIERVEAEIADLTGQMEANASDYQKLMELGEKKEQLDAQLEELYAQWEELSD